jgi:hypothetical protein
MPVKTVKQSAKVKPESNVSTGSIIPELTNQHAFNLVNTLESPRCGHFSTVYITESGYYFSEGNDLHEMVDLDPKVPAEALLIRQGKKQKRVLLPGKYIARKQIIREYSKEEILECRDEIIAAYNAEQKELKAKDKAQKAEDDDSPVKAITEALQKLSENKR